MKKRKRFFRFGLICLFSLSLLVAGCGDDDDTVIIQGGAEGESIDAQWARSGHADFDSPAFNDWNEEGEVPANCSRCHSSTGFASFVEDGTVEEAVPVGEVIGCKACHSSTRYENLTGTRYLDLNETGEGPLEPVTFPSTLTATLNGPSNMCMVCHQGRASKKQVDDAQPAAEGQPNAGTFAFINIHYYAAAATFFGTEVQGGYEYTEKGKSYVGQFTHVPAWDTCVECHMGRNANHTFEPEPETCAECHEEIDLNANEDEVFRSIRRGSVTDFDGDGNVTEGLYNELNDTLAPALLSEIQRYAATTPGGPIAYSPTSYPYFFKDTNANGQADEAEAVRENGYRFSDKKLLQAAYNYQVVQKEPCGYIHNARYLIQLMYDSIEDLGGDVSRFTRPTTPGVAPTANAGPDQTDIAIGTLVTLDATASTDPQNDPLTYSWQLQGPQGSTAALTGGDTANPTFTPDVAGTYTATLTASDGTNSATDTVVITTAGQQPPTVDGAALYANNGCAACHGAAGAGGIGPNIQNITVAELRAAPPIVSGHAVIATWSDAEAAAVVDFLSP